MKFRNLLILVLLFTYFYSNSQVKNKVIEDTKKHQKVLIGECTRSGLDFRDFGLHLNYEYKNYKPDKKIINKIKKKIEGVKITIVLGTWCKDSKEQMPRFLKILDEINFSDDDLTIIGVNSQMLALVMPVDDLEIKRVPTFIFYREGKEIGRIIETPKKTLEKDMLKKIR